MDKKFKLPLTPAGKSKIAPNKRIEDVLKFVEKGVVEPEISYISYKFSGIEVKFPFEAYPSQKLMMSKIVVALKEKKNALLESPTGSGKTLALLCAVMAWTEQERIQSRKEYDAETEKFKQFLCSEQKIPEIVMESQSDDDFKQFSAKRDQKQHDLKPPVFQKQSKIYYCSRTHRQLAQVIDEMRSNTVYRPQMSILGSRSRLCVNEVAKKGNLDDECRRLCKNNKCVFRASAQSVAGSKKLPQIWDIEEIIKLGKRLGGCPYYATRLIAENAEIVFCPYNYLINPTIRNSLNINIENNIFIIDEAHNIEDSARDAATCEITDIMFNMLLHDLRHIIKESGENAPNYDKMLRVVEPLVDFFEKNNENFEIVEFEREFSVLESKLLFCFFQTYDIQKQDVFEALDELKKAKAAANSEQDELVLPEAPLNVLSTLFLSLLYLLDPQQTDDFCIAIVHRLNTHPPDWVYQLCIWCMNPGIIFKQLSSARSVILTSGTLSPMMTFASELRTMFQIQLEAEHVIPLSQTWVGVIPQISGVPLHGIFRISEGFEYQDSIGRALMEICHRVPNGVLCFVPSYAFLNKIMARWKSTGILNNIKKKIHLEPKTSNPEQFEKTINSFYKDVQSGALMFGVYRGKVSEGIDFSDSKARAVVCIGLPFPSTKDPIIQHKKRYNDKFKKKHMLLSGEEWYRIQAFRAINQALGRCIRHKSDWGALILLESRFQTEDHRKGLSKWVRSRVLVHDFEEGMESLSKYVENQ